MNTPTPRTDDSETRVRKNGVSSLIEYCYANDIEKLEREWYEPETCIVCGGDEPCSHDFDAIGWPNEKSAAAGGEGKDHE
jgi:hypothetical protein